jgi:preprotein translocase subunit SecG
MYTREGITGSNPVLSANKKAMKRTNLIILVVLMFVLGLVYVATTTSEETEEQKTEEIQIEQDSLDLNDSISIMQVRQMDSLHALGKL